MDFTHGTPFASVHSVLDRQGQALRALRGLDCLRACTERQRIKKLGESDQDCGSVTALKGRDTVPLIISFR
jgi:hypothetical protein